MRSRSVASVKIHTQNDLGNNYDTMVPAAEEDWSCSQVASQDKSSSPTSLSMATETEIAESNVTTVAETKSKGSFVNKCYRYVFWIHFILITLFVIVLIVRGFLSSGTHNFHPKRWFIPVFSSTACVGIIGFVWLEFVRLGPFKAIKTAFWLS